MSVSDRAIDRMLGWVPEVGDTDAQLIAALLLPVDDMIADVAAMRARMDIDTADGVWLDRLGAILGERRQGLDDDDYRPILEAARIVRRSGGRWADLLDALAAMWATDDVVVSIVEPGVLYIQITVDAASGASVLARRAELLRETLPAGVGFEAVVEAVTGAFGFDDDDTAQGFDVGPFAELVL